MKQVLFFIKKIYSFAGITLFINLLAMVFISLFESFSILLVIPLLNATGIFTFLPDTNHSYSWIINLFKNMPDVIVLIVILCIYIALMISQSLFQRSQMIKNIQIQQGFTRFLREETYKSLIRSNWNYFLGKRRADLINIMTAEIGRVSGGIYIVLSFISSLVFTIIQIGIAFYLSAQMTLFVLFFGLSLIFFSRRFIAKSNSIGKESYALSKEYFASITDQLNGIKDIKSNTLEDIYFSKFSLTTRRMEKNLIEFTRIRSNSQFIYKLVSTLLIAIFFFTAIMLFKAESAQLLLILLIFSRLWPRFTTIQSNLEQISSTIPSLQAVMDLQNECLMNREIWDTDHDKTASLQMVKEIKCHDVFFKYSNNQKFYNLENINVIIPSNKMTAIVGQSGAGKSTLIDIILGLNQPERGRVFIDDVLLENELKISLRKSISYIPQDPFLFNTSIKENMLVVKPNAKEEEIWEALTFAFAEDFVRKLPSGLDTLIGDRGIRLSGGERQRLVLARAILRKPSILVLDEATSALDTENEAKIQVAIERLKGKMTIIVIAHRMSTIKNADQVIVLENGKVIQQGEYHDLSSDTNGVFAALLGKQMRVSH